MLQQIRDDQLDSTSTPTSAHLPAVTSVLQLSGAGTGWGHPIRRLPHDSSIPGERSRQRRSLRDAVSAAQHRCRRPRHGQSLYDKFDLLASGDPQPLQSTLPAFRNDWTGAEIAKHPEAFIVLVGHMGNGSVADRLYERLRPHFEERVRNQEPPADPAAARLRRFHGPVCYQPPHHRHDRLNGDSRCSVLARLPRGHPSTAFMRGHTVAMLEVLEPPS